MKPNQTNQSKINQPGLGTASVAIVEKSFNMLVKDTIMDKVDPFARSVPKLPKSDLHWSSQIFDPQFWLCFGKHGTVSFNAFATTDCRVLFNGAQTHTGVPITEVAGDNLDEKINKVKAWTESQLVTLAKRVGFIVHHQAASINLLSP